MDKNIIKFRIFKSFPEVINGISTRKMGSVKSRKEINLSNLKKIAKELNVDYKKIVMMNQIHEDSIKFVNDLSKNIHGDMDGLLTDKKNIFLGVITADCLPIVFYDSFKKIVGVVHAGYKGILSGVIDKMIKQFKSVNSNTRNIIVGIGPAIGVCCYNINSDREEIFRKKYYLYNNIIARKKNNCFLDLKKIAKFILIEQGILEKNIEVIPICTKCSLNDFYSYRGDTQKTFGEFITLIGISQ